MSKIKKAKHQSNRETRASKEPWLLQFGSMMIATIPYALFLWFFVGARFDTKTPNDGYIKYCFDEAKKCKEQGDGDGEKAWLLEAIKSACYTF